MTNEDFARHLRDEARTLSHRGDNLYRIRAFRQAAMAVLKLREPLSDLLAQAEVIPGIGASVRRTLATFVQTGIWPVEFAPVVPRKAPTDSPVFPEPSVGVALESLA